MKRIYSEKAGKLRAAAAAAAVCPVTVFICVLVCSWLTVTFDLPDGAVRAMSGISLCAGCFAGAFAAGNIRRRHGIAAGFAFGGAVFILLVIAGTVIMKSFSAGGALGKLLMILLCSAAGGVVGVNTKSVFR